AVSVLAELLRIAIVPLFFVLAGWSAVASLRARGAGRLMRERALRLLVPVCAGTILLCPVIKYIELRHGRHIGLHGLWLVPPLQGGFPDFVPHYFTRMVLLTWSPLWFRLSFSRLDPAAAAGAEPGAIQAARRDASCADRLSAGARVRGAARRLRRLLAVPARS